MVGGRRMTYVPCGQGPPLVCVPGGPGLPGDHFGTLGGLDRDWSLIRPDWRGAGISDAPQDGRHGVRDYADDLEQLRLALGLERMTLYSHSFGSLVASYYAVHRPDHVDRLVLDGTPDWQDRARIATLSLPEHFARRGESADAFARALSDCWYWPAINWFVAHEWDSIDPTEGLDRMATPTLVLTGEHEITFGPAVAARVASACANATVAVVAGAGHFTWFEEPAAFAREVRGFLQGASAGA